MKSTNEHTNPTNGSSGHNVPTWAKVRKRAILRQTTTDDWEKANDFQRQVIHQIELAIISVTEQDEDRHFIRTLTKLQ